MAAAGSHAAVVRPHVLQPGSQTLDQISGICLDLGPVSHGFAHAGRTFGIGASGKYQVGGIAPDAAACYLRAHCRLSPGGHPCPGPPVANARY